MVKITIAAQKFEKLIVKHCNYRVKHLQYNKTTLAVQMVSLTVFIINLE